VGCTNFPKAGVLPASRAEMAIVGPLVKNEMLLFTLTLALALGWMLWGARGVAAPALAADPAASTPELRLARAAAARERSWRRGLTGLGLVVVGVLASAFVTRVRIPGPSRPPCSRQRGAASRSTPQHSPTDA
jgi:hypothetical protein